MSLSRTGTLLLAIWLILFGLSGFINLGDLQMLLSVIAVIAGILLLISR